MTKEIKEILEALKHYDFSLDVPEKVETMINKLLNYITNLQTIEQEYSAILSENAELQEKLNKYEKTQTFGDYVGTVNELADLKEENKRLANELNKNMIERNKVLSKIEKAIELLKKYGNGTFDEKLLGILNGCEEK